MSDLLYARWWFSQYGLYTMDRVFFMAENRRRVAAQVEAHPGFREDLRAVARGVLGADDRLAVRRALSALAIVGYAEDVPVIRAAGAARGGDIAKDAGAAIYEIEHHAAAT